MSTFRVAVLYTHPLFGQGIARLLAEDPELDVTCHTAAAARAPLALANPGLDAIVMEDCEDSALTQRLIQALPPTLVAVVRLRDNAMEVYRGRRPILSPANTLLELLSELPGRTRLPAGSSRQALHHHSAL